MAKFISVPGILFISLASVVQVAISAPLAYVPNEKDGNVSVIDTASDKVLYTIPATGRFGSKIQAVAIDPSGQKLFVVMRDANAVAVVDLKKNVKSCYELRWVMNRKASASHRMEKPWQHA